MATGNPEARRGGSLPGSQHIVGTDRAGQFIPREARHRRAASGDPIAPGDTPRGRVNIRTLELARQAGRRFMEVAQADYEQAKREVTGETESDRQESVLDAPSSPNPRTARSTLDGHQVRSVSLFAAQTPPGNQHE